MSDRIDLLDDRIRSLEREISVLIEVTTDLKQKMDNHPNNCVFTSNYKSVIDSHIKDAEEKFDSVYDHVDVKIKEERDNGKWIVGIIVTVLIIMGGALISFNSSKVSSERYEKQITMNREDDIRRDERIQTMLDSQQAFQREFMKELADLNIRIANLSGNIEKMNRR